VTCIRGRPAPDGLTKLHLFADSGGFCQKPDCLRPLFVDLPNQPVHIAEIAHIFAATDGGPRSMANLSPAQRSDYQNLILLCPTSHTIIDKAPTDYPDTLIQEWKETHKARIAAAFEVVLCPDRVHLRQAIEPILAENRAIFELHGPDQDYRFNPESEMAEVEEKRGQSCTMVLSGDGTADWDRECGSSVSRHRSWQRAEGCLSGRWRSQRLPGAAGTLRGEIRLPPAGLTQWIQD
jgi:hypothetical protein